MVNVQYELLNAEIQQMPQTVPSSAGYSPSFDYSTFQFDLSLLPDDYGMTISQNTLKVPQATSVQIKQEVRSPRPGSPTTYPSPPYPGMTGAELSMSPNYSHEGSPGYPTSPYYVPRSPQSAQFYPTSPEPSSKSNSTIITKEPIKREKSFDLLTILQESRLLAESLGYREDSTDCTVPCTPPRTEEDIYNSLDADFFQKKKEESTIQNHPLLKEILFKEVLPRSTSNNNLGITFNYSSPPSTTDSSSPEPIEYQENNLSPLRDLLFKQLPKNQAEDTKDILKVQVEDSREKITIDDDKSLDREEELFKFKDTQKVDHQLLREVLRDTSFQRKYNLRPVDLGGVGTGFVEEMETGDQCVADLPHEQIEPVLSLAIQQLQKDFDNTCVALGIHPEPSRWSISDVAAWVQWARRQLQLPSVPVESFNIDGMTLASLTEEEFCRRAPQCGGMLHAQLEIWKAAVEESPRNTLAASWTLVGVVQSPTNNTESINNNNNNNTNNPNESSNSVDNLSKVENACSTSVQGSNDCTMDFSDDEDEDCSVTDASTEGIVNVDTGDHNITNQTANGNGKIRNGGSHIHLWQFLKELLQSPGTHGSCIRWLDRGKGVFKIEDSVRVARLWGKRKNRPAMNYDKLSRSIRQYYKKGIMKKTERSQRLVYQFCHPYSL